MSRSFTQKLRQAIIAGSMLMAIAPPTIVQASNSDPADAFAQARKDYLHGRYDEAVDQYEKLAQSPDTKLRAASERRQPLS